MKYAMASSMTQSTGPTLGICQWFHYEDRASVTCAVSLLRELNIRHLRTGISWADYHRPGGPQWYRWMLTQLAEFDLLVSIWHTPPSLSENGACNGPPRRLQDYADFIWLVLDQCGEHIDDIEIWNEPNNRYKWDFPNCDPQWRKFIEMAAMAGHTAQMAGRRAVLGGMIPIDACWLELFAQRDALKCFDVIAVHGFPEMWWPQEPNWEWHDHWHGWAEKVSKIAPLAQARPVWITETGLATWNLHEARLDRHDLQVLMLRQAAQAPVERVYWYSLIDLDPAREAIEGFHVDENEYHMGLVTHDGVRKPAFEAMKQLAREQASREISPSAGGRTSATTTMEHHHGNQTSEQRHHQSRRHSAVG